jgi:hypothetical protein
MEHFLKTPEPYLTPLLRIEEERQAWAHFKEWLENKAFPEHYLEATDFPGKLLSWWLAFRVCVCRFEDFTETFLRE